MSPRELRASLSLALVFSLRMFGLFLVLPVFALYARDLPGATPTAVGLALGVYGLTQALLQAPFGMLSDRIGRKPVIALGLVIFAAGSLLAGYAHSIAVVVAGRALQGAGAVGAVINALVADITAPEDRTKAMAVVGASIGLSFILALAAGPVLGAVMGVPGLFYLSAGLGVLCVIVLWHGVPNVPLPALAQRRGAWQQDLREVLGDPVLLRLDFGIFVQHLLLTALFVAVPIRLAEAGMISADQWQMYLPVILASIPGSMLLYRVGEARGLGQRSFLLAIAVLALSQGLLALAGLHLVVVWIALTAFFAGFNYLEASLPSAVSRAAPAHCRGVALGIYSSLQFLGIFCGGVLGGWLLGLTGVTAIMWFSAGLAVLWWAVSRGQQSGVYNRPVRS